MSKKKSVEIAVDQIEKENNLGEQTSADYYVCPISNGVSSVTLLRNIPEPQWRDTFNQINDVNKSILDGNLKHVEHMLLNQAHALEAIFYSSIEKISGSKYLKQAQAYTEMALKAQKQCRNTLIALAELKNPK